MKLQPIVYVSSMDDSTAWYSRLLGGEPSVRSEHWTSFVVGGGHLALHLDDEPWRTGSIGLSLVVDESLEAVAERCPPDEAIIEQPFGRSFVVIDPDGNRIQVNEHVSD